MDTFKFEQSSENGTLKLTFTGQISQASELPKIDLTNNSNLLLDLDGISYINSAGIKTWMLWISQIAKEFKTANIIIENLPSILIQQACTISDFLPARSRVNSFCVAYFCENCEAEAKQLFVNGKDYGDSTSDADVESRIDNKICNQCGQKMEVETTPINFFSILKTYR